MQNAKILIVEDEIIIALNIESILKKLGYSVMGIVSSGKDCLKAISHSHPELILMDIILEGDMDGIELAGRVREKDDIPIIFLTAYSDRSSLQKAKQTEPYGYIVKPVNEKDLYTTIETALYRNRVDRKLRESESKYRALFEQSRDAIYLRTPEGVITHVNQALLDLFGYDQESVIGCNINNFIHTELINQISMNLHIDGFVHNQETVIYNKNSSPMDCLITVTRLSDDHGNVTAYQGIIRDITDSRRSQKEREDLLHAISKRVNELNCLYSLSEYAENGSYTLGEIIEKMTEVIPQSWQYPDITGVRISLQGHDRSSINFRHTPWMQKNDIFVYGLPEGVLEICLLEERPDMDEGPFTREERDLLNALTERFSRLAERDSALHKLQEYNETLIKLSAHLQTVREEERTRIAREIHDELGQALTAIKMDVSWIRKRLPADIEGLHPRLEAILSLADKTIGSVRRISSDLRPGILDDLGLVPAIEWQADEIQARTGIECHVICDTDDIDMGDNYNVALFRIVQESLTNVVRHSDATKVEITLSQIDDKIDLEIFDNGKGIKVDEINNSQSFGLIGIRERVHFCNGTVQFTGNEGEGTLIRVTIPLMKN